MRIKSSTVRLVFPRLLSASALWLAASVAPLAWAQPLPPSSSAASAEFPRAAMGFLNEELPKMEGAVSERDRDYFEDAMGRMLDFSQQWGFKSTDNPALTRYATCTEAVSDFLVVGLCRLIPNGDVCEPRLAPRFDSNLKRCRELASGG
ncbi:MULTISPECIES: hypothetical protein [unclassified Variovorax]|jgi:hypothetical protein|uniref:hypothetical protein n=1 Tax=unclassified Variovorax TaxID=663243 RepID=UPI00164DF2F8|nr:MULTISPECIES: hypothetical protein [unclassified Variovorax]MBC7394759.1 hypothetical protein [Variovorax sp.]MEB0059551.1 hypothetical protein [Variovorax sp. LG9.2]MEB0114614.1 hypothetical protein [Variovorax sp. RTB1]QNK72159.1 hypothetical protein H7F36_13045 [Variovorax sp. PAMC28562]